MKIFQYIQGLKTGKEANQTEFKAMKDSFLADALDGYNQAKGNHKRQIEKLQNSITKKCRNKPNYTLIGGIAAASVIILGIVFYFLVIEPDAFSKSFTTSADKSPVKENTQKNKALEDSKSSNLTSVQTITEEEVRETRQKEISTPTTSSDSPSVSSAPAAINQPEVQATEIKRPETVQQNTVKETITTSVLTETPAVIQQNTSAVPEQKEEKVLSTNNETPAGITPTPTNDQKVVLARTSESDQREEVKKDIVKPKIKGKVTDQNGKPLSGASVSLVGANKTTTTNADGYFELDANDNSNIMVRSIGYDPVILTGSTSQNIQVKMEEVPKE